MVRTTLLPSATPELPECYLRIVLGPSADGDLVDQGVPLGTMLTFVIGMKTPSGKYM